jgi:hypothetical protein
MSPISKAFAPANHFGEGQARLLRVQSQQLPTESEVLEDEVLPGMDSADQPAEEMWERHDDSRNHIGKVRVELCPKSFILQVYEVLARYTLQAALNDACGGPAAHEPNVMTNEAVRTCALGTSNRKEWSSRFDVLQVTTMNGKGSQARCFWGRWYWLALGLLLCGSPLWSHQALATQSLESISAEPPKAEPPASQLQAAPQEPGKISGKVVDQTGANITGASVKLTRESDSTGQEVMTDEDGKFYFLNVLPGPFHLTFSSPGLAPREISGILHPGDSYVTPLMMLPIVTQVTQVHVSLTPEEVATAEIKEQEKQRVLGVIPNFYVSYVPNAAPLTTKLKFELAWKSSTDPFTFVAVGMVAGFAQAGDRWGAYGQGAQGYAKRFGATYADVVTGTFIGGAILPSILKQDPRYFYKGTGTKKSRFLYALANSVICKGDNGHWQPDYSSVLGNIAAGGISNLYYPSNDRSTAGVIFSTAFIRMGEMAVANIFQEFVVPKLTPNLPTRAPQSGDPPTF